jgi:uncharacterized Ntn-hydrolase superfamily protein
MTFSIAARCPRTGRFAIAVSSSSPAVAARCAHARAGVGAAASQNITDPTLGHRLLDLLAAGRSAREALDALRDTPKLEFRQLTVVDRHGGTAAFSGARTLGVHASAEGAGVVAAGNLLANPEVPAAMVRAFEAMVGADLGDRIVAAMGAGAAAGGEAGPVHSAGLLMVDRVAWPVADLRVDWTEADPVAALADLWTLWKPQLEAYVTRALDPASAPAYGVAGEP